MASIPTAAAGFVLLLGNLAAQGQVTVTNFFHDMSTLSHWTDVFSVSAGTSAAGMLDPNVPLQTVIINANHGSPSSIVVRQNFGSFTQDVDFQAVTGFTADITLRANSTAPVTQAITQYQFQSTDTNPGDGKFHYAILTVRRTGTLEFQVFAWDAGLASTKIVDGVAPAQRFPNDYSNTFRITRDASGLWTVARTDTGATIVNLTESPVVNNGRIDRIEIREFNNNSGISEPWAFHDEIQITSIVPTSEFGFTNITVSDETGFRFDSQDGVNYDLQWSSNMVDWISKDFTIHGKGGTVTTFDPGGFDSNRHYRIVTVD